MQLIVPQLVVDEFKKNRERVSKARARGVANQVQQVKEAVRVLGINGPRKKALLAGQADSVARVMVPSDGTAGIPFLRRHRPR